ncbi:MAG: thiamine-phosphate kinase [Proteobacteria bacterium]|nr:thiamine-phosphate kinase [Pseudomonadota bacterium]MBU1739564.1 thiamine-phosphate kinase [Pseudomonadota bacterium]
MKIAEREIIERIRRSCPKTAKNLVAGIGDDCAVIARGEGLLELLTTDMLMEGIHFNATWHPPELLGRKAAAVNLSDIAAMGGSPKYTLLSLALPEAVEEQWLEAFISGFLQQLSFWNVALVGGDTVRSPGPITLSVTVIGEVDRSRVLSRSGAQAGDCIMVSGILGEAAAGLELCRSGRLESTRERWPELLKAHLDPEPEIRLGIILAETGMVKAMMDMSDGLATDLAHLCRESGCGAEIEANLLPISPSVRQAAAELELVPDTLALSGGEDYRLLFTVAPESVDRLLETVKKETGRKMYKVGRIVGDGGVFLLEDGRRREIGDQGYDHFR